MTVDEAIHTARMNFNHFISTDRKLSSAAVPELLHELLRQCAGLQLEQNQEAWDLLIPTYFGPSNEEFEFDLSSLSAIIVQVKNKGIGEHLDISPATLRFFKGLHKPVLSPHLDLGVSTKAVSTKAPKAPTSTKAPKMTYVAASTGKHPAIWGVHITGADEQTYASLSSPGLKEACLLILAQMKLNESINDRICRANIRFNEHYLHLRFPGFAQLDDGDAEHD
jgi:hypothetical protein